MTKKSNQSWYHWLISRLRNHFLSGLLVVVPIAATILVLIWVFRTIDDILQPIIKVIVGHTITGLGFGITIVLVFVVGIIAGNYVGRRLIALGDSVLKRVPLFRQIYTGAKQVVEGLAGTGSITKAAFREVVLVEFPTKGMTHVAFITNEFTAQDGRKLFAVYMPSTPVPWSGFSGIVNEDMITRTTITVDEALKMVISGVLIAPHSLEISNIGRFTSNYPAQPPKNS
jgi:uncharacterized membrane protein